MGAFEAAAKWWSRACGHGFKSNGDDSARGGLITAMATMLSKVPDRDTASKFEATLRGRLEKSWKERGRIPEMGTDYGPDTFLDEVAQEAGMDSSAFPWKTRLSIWTNEKGPIAVVAYAGYGARPRVVWEDLSKVELGSDTHYNFVRNIPDPDWSQEKYDKLGAKKANLDFLRKNLESLPAHVKIEVVDHFNTLDGELKDWQKKDPAYWKKSARSSLGQVFTTLKVFLGEIQAQKVTPLSEIYGKDTLFEG